MECILVFASFGEGEPLAGERGGGAGSSPAACWLEVESGPGEALTPSVLSFLPLRTDPDGKPQGCHRMPRLGPYLPVPKRLPTQARAGHDRWVQPWSRGVFPSCPHSFPSSKLGLSPPLLYTCTFFPSLSPCSSSLPLPVHSTCLKKKTIFKGGGLLSCLHLRCCRFES